MKHTIARRVAVVAVSAGTVAGLGAQISHWHNDLCRRLLAARMNAMGRDFGTDERIARPAVHAGQIAEADPVGHQKPFRQTARTDFPAE